LAEVTIDARNHEGWMQYAVPIDGDVDGWARLLEHGLIREPASAPIGDEPSLGQVTLRSNGKTLMLYLQWTFAALAVSALAIVFEVLGYSRRLAASIVNPIADLARLTRQVRESRSFERRAKRVAVHEIDALTDDFNALLSELQVQKEVIDAHHLDLRLANEALRKLSRHDPLTELPNRAYLGEHLEDVIQRCTRNGQQAGLIFIDTDRFKEINDRFGHRAGDALLVELSKRLRESMRDTDFVARLGGDEFVIVISPLRESVEVARLTDRIRHNLSRRVQLPGGELALISVTMGVAIFPDHAESANALIAAADEAMYRAKAVGRGSVGTFKPVGDASTNHMACPWIKS
jgi:diguanylate cyclase (GGDEF)-like protein